MFYLFLIGLIILIYIQLFQKKKSKHYTNEYFIGAKKIVKKKKPLHIYDKFYANIYDELFDSDMKNEFECMFFNKDFITKNNPDTHILDIGCGTGQHLKILSRYGHKVSGLDLSKYMLNIAKDKLPKKTNLVEGDFHQPGLFPKKQFSHILCLFYTIYYSKNIDLLFKNCNRWLKPNGYLFIHVINRDKFDPVLERSSSLIPFFDPQKNVKKRTTNTQLVFDKFQYQADWNFDQSKITVFSEDFEFKSLPYIRQNKHILYYYKQKIIEKTAIKKGFKLVKIIDELTIGFNYNYILCFQKKYGD